MDMGRTYLLRLASLPIIPDHGYTFLDSGGLCQSPSPPLALVPLERIYFLCLESVFTCIFFTAFYTIMEPLWSVQMPWTRDSVSWGGLNSHLPLREGVGAILNLTPEELESIAAAWKARMQAASKAAYDRERENDLDAFLLRKRTGKNALAAKHPDNVKASHARTVAKIKSEKRFFCNDCDYPFASSTALAKHLNSGSHAQQVAINNGAVQAAPSQGTLRVRRCVQKIKAEKRYYCSTCDHNAAGPVKLEIHKKTKGHLKRAAKLDPGTSS